MDHKKMVVLVVMLVGAVLFIGFNSNLTGSVIGENTANSLSTETNVGIILVMILFLLIGVHFLFSKHENS